TRRVKWLSYVSTVGVMSGRSGLPDGTAIREDEDIRSVFTERAIDSGYASGYGTSKWAGELILRDANEKLNLPVAVYRPSGILTHTRYRGQVNVPDFFTRLLAGIIYARVAPKSFYTANASARTKHYDGLSVDVVARSIVAPSVDRQRDTARAR